MIGCGQLDATHAACMAAIGREVVGVDIDEGKVSLLNSGKAWFYEPGLDEMPAENTEPGPLRFTTSFAEAGAFADVHHFLGVATQTARMTCRSCTLSWRRSSRSRSGTRWS